MTGDRLLRRLAPVILGIHLACGVAPRAMVFAHHHHGDEHEHVHAWGADAVADDDDHHDEHDHVEDRERPNDGRVAFEADGHHRHADHVHTQSPYPVANTASIAAVFVAWQAVALAPLPALAPAARPEVPSSARGPPRPLV